MENESYPFARLDQVVDDLLNLSADEHPNLQEAENIRQYFLKEIRMVYQQLKADVFKRNYMDNSEAVISAYLKNLSYLISDLRAFVSAIDDDRSLNGLASDILNGLETLEAEISWRFASQLKGLKENANVDKASIKVLCNLSVDQIGLLLKAADEIRLCSAKSFSQLLRHIVPYLSTDRMETFSWKSARSSTYKVEAHDIEVTLEVLQKLMAKIKDYY
ncbi:hypothetical protein FPZ42_06960 [Mucilaginibacter achroorhodeus]|uniref:Uncharacterized protein n=1 Tax=Mucilaginibacter achroorhodeus TaxID=2599294 RepID=A0A563U5Z4_9SPHI|nr:hypothetical protein [Mucilaginibacter achroorhodeus]TWR26770.1 hypothetical protein FPZ42_06960 [Mucilaginibacter achroorhodeus]